MLSPNLEAKIRSHLFGLEKRGLDKRGLGKSGLGKGTASAVPSDAPLTRGFSPWGWTFSVVAIFAIALLPACSINVKDKKQGDDAKVDIKTPLGDLHVNEGADVRDTGLTLYPGAKPAPKDSSNDHKSANVNLSFGGYGLKVVAAEFVSDDASDKVLAYYNKELQHFGKPIECHGKWNGGDVNVNSDDKSGLSKPVSCRSSSGGESTELKVGSEGNQHIVAVKSNGMGTRFALVYVRMHTGKDDTI